VTAPGEAVTDADHVAALEAEFSGWQIWIVPAYIGPTTWCARRRDGAVPIRALNAGSPAELAEMIREREIEEAGQ
jgi:hypothetical protein